jgi:hypothetical protein
MRYFNRIRGSLDVPVADGGFMTSWGHTSGSWSGEVIRRSYVLTKDLYEPYGVGVWHYKPFHSTKLHIDGGTVPWVTNRSCPHLYSGVLDHWGAINENPPDPEGVITPKESDGECWARLGGRVDSRLPSLKPDIDLFVFIAELKDIKELANLITLKGKGILGKAANADLAIHFGLLPLLGELKGLCGQVLSVFERIKALEKGAGKVHDFSTNLTRSSSSGDWELREVLWDRNLCGYSDPCPPNNLYPGYYIRWTEETRFSATVKYRYEFPPKLFGDEIAQFTRALGVFPDHTSLWELIPFSFVVDWFLNTGRLFDGLMLDETGYDVKTEIIDVCVVKHCTEYLQSCFVRPCLGMALPGPCASHRSIVTDRWVGNEALDLIAGPWLKLPGFTQLHLGAALIKQVFF